MTTDATHRWRGVVALSLFAGAAGLLAQRPAVLLLATVGVGYALYPRLAPAPPDPALAVERAIEPASPSVGETVDVTVTVRNESDRWLPDVRVVDGVPALLEVEEGTPRRATALGPGDETTVEYAVAAASGKHRFEPTTVLLRDVAGAVERRTTVAEPTVLDCGAPVTTADLRSLTTRRPGVLRTDEGGAGLEFHRAREYRRGDPMNRVDWRRFARSGELGTVEFREERAASVVVCVDLGGGPSADGAAVTGTAHADARSLAAADRLADAVMDAHHEVGLAAIGARFYWLPPAHGAEHRTRIRQALDAHPAFLPASPAGGSDEAGDAVDRPQTTVPSSSETPLSPGPAVGNEGASRAVADGGRSDGDEPDDRADADGPGDRARQVARLRERLGSDTQVLLLSPLADPAAVDAVQALEAAGNLVTVVSPDTTATETVGNRLAAAERATRIRRVRRFGVPVVDWGPDEHLGPAIADAAEGGR